MDSEPNIEGVAKRSIKRSHATLRKSTIQLPNEDTKSVLHRFTRRYAFDGAEDYRFESVIITPPIELKYKPNDNADVLSREPSFTTFKIPYSMICRHRYQKSTKAYEAQLNREIRNIIDFHSNAADACFFVRCMAITSFWPPLHHMSDVKRTSKQFFQLSEKERWRLQLIMDTNII